MEKDCVGKAKPRACRAKPVKLRFIQNVANCYVLCLTKESVITATLVHVRVCACVRARVCVCVCASCTPHGVLSDTSVLEISSGLNSRMEFPRTGVRTLRSPGIDH